MHLQPLLLLLDDMEEAGLLPRDISNSLAATFWQQLCQAGLYKFAADCMTDTAEQLQAAAVFHGASLLHPPDFSVDICLDSGSVTWAGGQLRFVHNSSSSSRMPAAAGSSSSSSSANAGPHGTTPGGRVVSVTAESLTQLNRRLSQACGLLHLYPKLSALYMRERGRDAPHDFMLHVTPAACHLAVASMQYIASTQRSIQQQQQQQQQGSTAPQEPGAVFVGLMDCCSMVLPLITATAQLRGGAGIMQGFYLLPCMAMALLMQTYSNLAQQHTLLPAAQAYTGSSSSSSSSGSSSKSKTKRSKEKQRPAASRSVSSSSSSSSSQAGSKGRAADAAATPRKVIQAWRGVAGQLDRLLLHTQSWQHSWAVIWTRLSGPDLHSVGRSCLLGRCCCFVSCIAAT